MNTTEENSGTRMKFLHITAANDKRKEAEKKRPKQNVLELLVCNQEKETTKKLSIYENTASSLQHD